MTVRHKRIFNYRPLCFCAAALVLGIILGEASYGEHIAIIISLSLFAFVLFCLSLIFKKVRRLFYIPLAMLVGLISITTSNAVYDGHMTEEYHGSFTAKVASEIILEDESASFYVSDIRVNGRKLKYDGYVYVNTVLEPDFNAGDTVEIGGMLLSREHKKFDTYYASGRANGVGFFIATSSVTKLSEGDAPFPLNLQLKVKRILYENTDSYTASICQALILGDKRGIDDDLYDNISASGLAHVLAVSGLHITTLAAALYFLLKKLKVNPKIAFVIVTVLTFVYSMLCSFTASSLRAFIMCAVFSFASVFGQKRDNLSALSLAAILILIFRPTALMEIGFELSFFAVLGIFLFYGSFRRIGMKAVDRLSPKRHFGKRLVDVCAVSLSTNLMTLPLVALFFGRVPTLFLLANFIVLPYVMALYIVLLICTLLALITTFGGFVWIMKILFIPFRVYVALIGNLSFATVPVTSSVCGIVCYEIIAIGLSKFIFAKRRTKAVFASVGTALSVIICAICALA
ncbi:MAG: ComEC/Rec2 family competence protein [Clostridia bacterium]|nr:ComEC/Rec2 family competence protein [Clostridia bacterium]